MRRLVSIGMLWKAVERIGYAGKFSPYGIRATGSTVPSEMKFRPDVIESQRGHQERNKTRILQSGRVSIRAPRDDAGIGRLD
ncbi:MAG: hypothetical protein SGI99_12170 [Pseudomonadota bacterium]|nr:hypothetical protein [Pseudomonadota bacterium]